MRKKRLGRSRLFCADFHEVRIENVAPPFSDYDYGDEAEQCAFSPLT
jgi:hypothetical protein